MASVTRSAGAGANVATAFDDAAWSNPGNITASDNSYATAQQSGGMAGAIQYLKASNFGFSIDSGATINGIEVLIERKDGGGSFADTEILILNGDGSAGVGSTNRSAGAAWPTSDTTATFGSSSDSWGETWTPAKINSSNFGVQIRCNSSPSFGVTDTASVDHIQITVHYSAGSSSNNVRFGSATITKAYLGSQQLSKIRLGSAVIEL